jgi:hypothetical protein
MSQRHSLVDICGWKRSNWFRKLSEIILKHHAALIHFKLNHQKPPIMSEIWLRVEGSLNSWRNKLFCRSLLDLSPPLFCGESFSPVTQRKEGSYFGQKLDKWKWGPRESWKLNIHA